MAPISSYPVISATTLNRANATPALSVTPVRFGDFIESDATNKELSPKAFMKSGFLMTAGNAAWLAVLMGIQALTSPKTPDKHVSEPAPIVRSAPESAQKNPFESEEGPLEPDGTLTTTKPPLQHKHPANQSESPKNDPHAGHSHESDNFWVALWDHMPLETANDTIRGVMVTLFMGAGLWARNALRRKKTGHNNNPSQPPN